MFEKVSSQFRLLRFPRKWRLLGVVFSPNLISPHDSKDVDKD